MGYLWDALGHAYQLLGFEEAAGGDEVFRSLLLARIVEPTSKLDSLRVVEEAGFDPPAYATLKRRLPAFAKESWQQKLGSPKNAAWSRRSRSGCSPTQAGFR
ncbi:hypothetical protein JCM33774_37850 [Actinophytocola sp. KF-1]